MNFYNAFGQFFEKEGFSENKIEAETKEIKKDLTDYNVYSHITLSSINNKIRITLFPIYFGDKGYFNLSMKGNSEIKYNVIKSSVDSSYINNPIHLGSMFKDGDELDNSLFAKFRIYDKKLQLIDNGNFINLFFNFETKKITSLKYPSNLHLFDFSPSGSEINIFNNDPIGNFYKINRTRNTFYLTTDKEKTQFVKTTIGTTTKKEEASIFMFVEIDPKQKVRNETRIDLPKEEKDGSGAIKNQQQIFEARARKVLFHDSFKYNILELVKNSNNDWQKVKLKFINDEIRGNVVFVPLTKEEDSKDYQLQVWINEL